MKKIVLSTIVLLSCSIYSQEAKKTKKTDEKKVYICNSITSKAYHYKKKCTGLLKCKDTIRKVSLKKATNYGRIRCGYEASTDKQK